MPGLEGVLIIWISLAGVGVLRERYDACFIGEPALEVIKLPTGHAL